MVISLDSKQHSIVYSKDFSFSKSMGIDLETIPDYLLEQNQAFENKMSSIRPSTIPLENLKEIAILMYRMMLLELVKSLWITYRKSGTGDLSSMKFSINVLNNKVWPSEVKSFMKLSKFNRTMNNDEENSCLNFVNDCLNQLDNQNEQYRQQMTMKTGQLIGYTYIVEHNIKSFIEEMLTCERIENDRHMALVQYHYMDILLKRAYLAQNPTQEQV